MSDQMERWAECQRQLRESEIQEARAKFRHEQNTQFISMCMSIYFNAELGPMYATLNPDPRAYGIARAGADRLQAIALKAMAEGLA